MPASQRPLSAPSSTWSETILRRYVAVRARTMALTDGLSAEDQQVQSMPDASPAKWHLAHTSWFFETFILQPHAPDHRPFDPDYGYLFNSYYESVGERHARPERGLLTRPSLEEVHTYRRHVDKAMAELIAAAGQEPAWRDLLELGLHHEEQHQELILMDIKHAFSRNPLQPPFAPSAPSPRRTPIAATWRELPGGLVEIGHAGPGFAFDNEGPRHKVWLEPFRIADQLVTCGDWMAFMDDGGYAQPLIWLSEGWAAVQREAWAAPAYWTRGDDGWTVFTLTGPKAIDPAEPVAHVSFFEADAFARWAGRRLPTEAEWETAAALAPPEDEGESLHPAAPRAESLAQMRGQVWQWTGSAYQPYPRYRAAKDATGEYNGKFMSGQMVLRGGACVTPPGHSRITYRNFFPPAARWAFSGVRLADDV